MVLSGLRATVKVKDGAKLDSKLVEKSLKKAGLEMVSQSSFTIEEPKVVYVLALEGVG